MKTASLLLLTSCCLLPLSQAAERDVLINKGKRYPLTNKIDSIPQPPLGKRWVLNEQYSDEFNGNKLDSKKWLDYHPNWKGREPGLFEAKNVSMKDGHLILKGEKMKKPQIIKMPSGQELSYNISCAAVVSKEQQAHYGYYECRFKANKTTLSSTFWLSTRGAAFDTAGRQDSDAETGKFSQELDICECIGRTGDFSGKHFYLGMNANVHYWFTPKGGEKQDIRIKETKLYREDGKVPSEDFNTYGCWWKDESNVSFYLNNEQETEREFVSKDGKIDFKLTEPMGMNLVVETYMEPWISLPEARELADERKNRTYYDWVRSYTLVDADSPTTGRMDENIFKTQIRFTEESVEIGDGEVKFRVAYTTGEDCTAVLMIVDEKNQLVGSKKIKAVSGYTHREVGMGVKLREGGKYIAVVYITLKGKVKGVRQVSDAFEFRV